jgi:hypothetical protein
MLPAAKISSVNHVSVRRSHATTQGFPIIYCNAFCQTTPRSPPKAHQQQQSKHAHRQHHRRRDHTPLAIRAHEVSTIGSTPPHPRRHATDLAGLPGLKLQAERAVHAAEAVAGGEVLVVQRRVLRLEREGARPVPVRDEDGVEGRGAAACHGRQRRGLPCLLLGVVFVLTLLPRGCNGYYG